MLTFKKHSLHFNYILLASSILLAISACTPLNQYALVEMPLLSVDLLKKNWQVTQSIKISPDRISGNTGSTAKIIPEFISAWATLNNQLTVVGLTSTGQLLMRLHYSNQQFTETYSPLVKQTVPGREILAQLQLAHWPIQAIEETFEKTQWKIVQQRVRQGHIRKVYLKNQLVLDIIYTSEYTPSRPNDVIIRNHPKQYKLQITTLTATDL